jgi:hypothetical protein
MLGAPFATGVKLWVGNSLDVITFNFQRVTYCSGGADGTRTRDPRRDRPVF